MIKTPDSNVVNFDSQKRGKATRVFSCPKNHTPEKEYASATLSGDCYRHIGIFSGDTVIYEIGSKVRHGDMAVLEHKENKSFFVVYFVGDKTVLVGEDVLILDASEYEFLGRVIR